MERGIENMPDFIQNQRHMDSPYLATMIETRNLIVK